MPYYGDIHSIQYEFKKRRQFVRDYRAKDSEVELLPEEEISNLPISGVVVVGTNKVQDPMRHRYRPELTVRMKSGKTLIV